MDRDRRETERLAILGALQGEVMVYQPMVITDLGVGGVTVETAFPLHLGSLHELRLPLSNCSVVLKGRVVHSGIVDVAQDVVRYRSGLEFVEPSEHVKAALADFVTSIRTSRGV